MAIDWITANEYNNHTELAEAILDDAVCGGILKLLQLRGVDVRDKEWEQAGYYAIEFTNLADYKSIRFMLACFTLLEAGDDNF